MYRGCETCADTHLLRGVKIIIRMLLIASEVHATDCAASASTLDYLEIKLHTFTSRYRRVKMRMNQEAGDASWLKSLDPSGSFVRSRDRNEIGSQRRASNESVLTATRRSLSLNSRTRMPERELVIRKLHTRSSHEKIARANNARMGQKV